LNKRIAYYLWRYPIVSETFIQREIKALKDSGLNIVVYADSVDKFERNDPRLIPLINDTIYLLPINKVKLLYKTIVFLIKSPKLFADIFSYVNKKQYSSSKNFIEDIRIFLKSLYLARLLRKQGISHIHSPWSDVNSFIALVASKIIGLPLSIQARAHDIHRKDSAFGLIEKFGGSKFIVTNTKYNEQYIKKILKSSEWEKINLIYNGIDLNIFNPGKRKIEKNKEIYLLCVARLIPQKGLTYLLKACDILIKKGINFKCKIIGGTEQPRYGDYYYNLLKLKKDLGLEEYLNFEGVKPFEYTLEQYNSADIFVLPCVIAEDGSRDIIPNVLIEAMAMKLPVISTTVTGVPEIVDDDVNGILVPPNDDTKLADSIIRLIEDVDLRHKLGEKARMKVEKRFNINKNIQSYISLFS
jgi:glycosyltransferase involved in cell wall biosynthesis